MESRKQSGHSGPEWNSFRAYDILDLILISSLALLQMAGPTHAVNSEFTLHSYNVNAAVEETFHLSKVHGRDLLQSPSPSPVLHPVPTPSPILYPVLTPSPTLYPVLTPTPTPYFHAPGPSISSASGPAPMPILFPSDPPVTIPFSPAPGVLTIPPGNCSIDLAALEPTIFTTATDCSSPYAVYVGVAMCCPQIDSLLRIVQGQHIAATGALGLNVTDAQYCYSEIANIISSTGTNSSLLCSVHASNLTVGSCPVKTVEEFEQMVNTSSLLQACENINPILSKECSSRTCQNEIGNATLLLVGGQLDAVDDCSSVVLSWLASQSSAEQSNIDLRLLTSCSVNQECPLVFNDTSSVAKACNSSTSNVTCCEGLSLYIENVLQTQMLVTNQQAYTCAEKFGTNLQRQAVTTDIYSLCQIHLSDFSLQVRGQEEGCLLSSLPTDINITTGTSYFICDLNDNILAQWPDLSAADTFPPSPLSVSPSPLPSQPSFGTSMYNGNGLTSIIFTFTALALSLNMS